MLHNLRPNPGTELTFEVVLHDENDVVQPIETVSANSWEEALLWYLSGYNQEVYETLNNVICDFSCTLGTVYVWINLESEQGAFGTYLITVRNITDYLNSTDEYDTCENVVEMRRKERRERKKKENAEKVVPDLLAKFNELAAKLAAAEAEVR